MIPRENSDECRPIGTVIVATDFSDCARRALDWAVALSSACGARVVLVHAISPYATSLPVHLQAQISETADCWLEAEAERVRASGVALTPARGIGAPWEIVAEQARSLQADLIVVGSRGHTAFERLLLGSNADRIIRTAPAPVLTVHPSDAPAPKQIGTVVVGVDLSEGSLRAVAFAERLLQPIRGRARIVLVHSCMPALAAMGPDAPVVLISDWDESEQEAREELERIASELRTEHLDVDVNVHRGHAVEAIQVAARNAKADLMVLGTQGRTGLGRYFLGSVAERVVHYADRPVVTVGARATAAGARPAVPLLAARNAERRAAVTTAAKS
jgi:nucleotide-binding universal stress UspA family protein